jgi:hypothetical protein
MGYNYNGSICFAMITGFSFVIRSMPSFLQLYVHLCSLGNLHFIHKFLYPQLHVNGIMGTFLILQCSQITISIDFIYKL